MLLQLNLKDITPGVYQSLKALRERVSDFVDIRLPHFRTHTYRCGLNF